MAAISSHVSSPTEPDLKRPKLDHGDKDEEEKRETIQSIDRRTNTESNDDNCTQQLQDLKEKGSEFCKHGDKVESDSTFGDKDSSDSSSSEDEDSSDSSSSEDEDSSDSTSGDEDESDSSTSEDEDEVDYDYIDHVPVNVEQQLPLQCLKENDSATHERIVELSKLALAYYHDNHPEESYEFESVQKVTRRVVQGSEYSLAFCAKNMRADGNPLEIFEARAYDLAGADPKIRECVLLK